MKKLLLFTLILFPLVLFAQDPAFDFRQTRWGMSRWEVRKSESSEIIKDEADQIAYKATVNSLNVLILYNFNDSGQLYSTAYGFTQEHSNKNDYLVDYLDFEILLVKKYGDPNFHEEAWNNDLYKDERENWGLAVSIGHLRYKSIRETDRAKIIHFLKGDNYEILHCIIYQSVELSDEQIDSDNQKILNEL